MSEVAGVPQIANFTLSYWRRLGTGVASFRVGRGVRYWRGVVARWLYDQGSGTPVVTPAASSRAREVP